MSQIPQDIVDDIINRLDPEQIPAEYIVMAKITDLNGNEKIISGDDLVAFMKSPFDYAAEARIILNIQKIRKAIIAEVNAVYDEVNLRYSSEFPDE
jgi:hypothetical protein